MAKLNFDQLTKALGQTSLSPVYLITGDEPLTVQESCDAVRAAARKAGFSERELYHTDSGFQWPQLLYSANSMSLFADRKIIEIRIHDGKPGDAGSKALIEYCRAPAADNLLLLVCPKLERASQNSKWYQAIESIGTVVTIWPVDAKAMPRWIEQRLQRAGIRADSQAIDILASRVEGNLLAAAQEIEKLKLVAQEGIIDGQTMAVAVVDSARYDVFGLVDKALIGNAQGAATTLNGLRAEGSEPTIILWALTREIRALIALKQALSTGQSFEGVARCHGIFDKRVPLVRGALQRLPMPTLRLLLKECAYIDRSIKGMAAGDCWGTLLDVVLTLSGNRAFSGRVLKTLLT
jgi:DNA polymerase III subunit delta